eukprot:m51a1_g3083 hypothetical protein (243) ;mRNA; f:56833-57649
MSRVRECAETFAAAFHPRLGQQSPVPLMSHVLMPDVFRLSLRFCDNVCPVSLLVFRDADARSGLPAALRYEYWDLSSVSVLRRAMLRLGFVRAILREVVMFTCHWVAVHSQTPRSVFFSDDSVYYMQRTDEGDTPRLFAVCAISGDCPQFAVFSLLEGALGLYRAACPGPDVVPEDSPRRIPEIDQLVRAKQLRITTPMDLALPRNDLVELFDDHRDKVMASIAPEPAWARELSNQSLCSIL